MRLKTITGAAAGIGLVSALAVPGIANAASTVSVLPRAELQGKGGVVDVFVAYTCDPGFTAGTSNMLSQGPKKKAQVGFGNATGEFICDGTQHVVTVEYEPPFGAPWKKGPAQVTVQLGACNEVTCAPPAVATQDVHIK